MTTKRQTLNSDKRKVIADVFQSHFEDNSKYKKQHQDAITNYNLMREQAKVKMNDLVRFHQPQEDVDTIRKMIGKYNESGNKMYHKDEWENDFKIWVIGTSYCHSRQFQTKDYEWFNKFKVAQENVILAHKNLFANVERKMEKLRMGLKSYRYFDQAKELADKLGVVLNESVLNESSSMALSIYSPTNLADLLTDEVEQTREEKIAIAKQLLREQQSVN